jgi:hypothetical protein
MSARERKLAIGTAVVVLAVAGYAVFNHTTQRIQTLDREIADLQQRLWQNTYQAEMLDAVRDEYAAVATRHSNAWTEAEIHSILLNEILRLAMQNPPPENSPEASLGGPWLVQIPTIPPGQLDERGEGFREYQIKLTTRPTSVRAVALFLSRLQESPHMLRIDRLEVERLNWQSEQVTASLTITRPIIGVAPDAVEEPAAGQPAA